MTADQVMEVMKEAMMVAFEIAGPLLIVSIVVGLIVAVFQAATQIHEQTLTFVLILVIALLVIVTAVVVYQYAKAKGLEGIRKDVYALFLVAEHEIKGTKQGQQRLKWVVQQARGLLPKWLQTILSEDALMKIIDWWFKEVKDLLDDGKVNGSQN